ncbi:uncharacterized protein LOC110856386 [Folsomia candida]|uniref:uncharacterized protein LOC110856386 n=1 Tax=Folsomia candida TaxID=158441 RepID=UPI001604EC3E|nr:uncharacterized protein LOC110856386 [Folsomia candida]
MTSKIRSAWRTKATTYCRQATEEFKKLAPNKKWLKILKLKLEEVRIKLQAIEETSMNETTTSGDGEDEKYEEYDEKILCCIADIEEECQPDPQQAQQQQMGGAGGGGAAMGGAGATSSSSYYFPRLKLREFSGELTEWLGFWDSFKIVHDDKGLDDVRKFQFLLGCMVPGSKAKEVVESYPMNAANYAKAVEALRSNFGKEKLLQLVYVRELLSMSNGRNGHESLSSLFNKLKSRYEALQTLGVTTQQASIFLYAIVESCLSEDVLTAWQRSSDFGRDGSKERPPKTDMDYLMDFLQREVENEVQRNMARSGYGETSATPKSSSEKGHHRERRDTPSTAANLFGGAVHDGKQQCLFCKKGHPSAKCWKAQRMSLEERQHLVRNCGVCFSCLQGGHLAKSCKAGVQCSLCTKRGHLALMCRLGSDKKTDEGPDANVAAHMVSQSVTKDVQLYTLNVKLRGKRGIVDARLLFDSGCQRSYVKKSTVAKLGISAVGREEFRKALFGGQLTEVKSHNRYKLELLNVDGQRPMSLEFLEEDTICAKIGRVPPGPGIAELAKKKVTVGDVGHGSAEIDLLIGGDQFGQLLTNKVIQLECGLTAIETSLGWTVGGRVPVVSESKCEEVAKQHFQENVTKDDDGRFCVALPWKNGEQKMSSNRVVAEKRLESATKNLVKEGYLEKYNKVFRDWEMDGVIEAVKEESCDNAHYLPHRAVIKPESATTPVRPVFDGSCKFGRNPSLNDLLEVGPNLLESVPSILLRFRRGRFGVTADIRKAFLMVGVRERDRDYLRFLWWEDISKRDVYKIYRHKRVVFGVNSSPFLLGAAINHQLEAKADEFPSTCEILRESFYVDNLVCSVDSKEDQDRVVSQATSIMGEVKMELTQWGISLGGLTRGATLPCESSLKVLGMKWDTAEDCLTLDIPEFDMGRTVTKRTVLADPARIFDPLGLVCAVMVLPKIILQKSWKDKTGWDEALGKAEESEYVNWLKQLPMLSMLKIPRHHFAGCDRPEGGEIHAFSDASYRAYAAVIFIRFKIGKDIVVKLLQARSRVAPMQKITIPRLELLGCYITANLTIELKKSLQYENMPTFFWSDSTTALAWIKRNDELGTFVGNRVSSILESTVAEQWRHVPDGGRDRIGYVRARANGQIRT